MSHIKEINSQKYTNDLRKNLLVSLDKRFGYLCTIRRYYLYFLILNIHKWGLNRNLNEIKKQEWGNKVKEYFFNIK